MCWGVEGGVSEGRVWWGVEGGVSEGECVGEWREE